MPRIFTHRRAQYERSSLLASLDAWGRLTGSALAVVAAVLLGMLLLDQLVYDPRVDRAVNGVTAVRHVHEAMLDQQVGLRGYLLSGDERFLDSYERGRDALPSSSARSTEILSGSDEVGAQLVEMRIAQQTWLDRWAAPALERGDSDQAVGDEFLEDDKRLFDAYRARYDNLLEALLREREDALSEQRTARMGGFLVALFVIAGAGAWATKRSRALHRAVAGPVDQLLSRIDEIGRGQLEPAPPIDGPTELAVLGDGLEACAVTLADARRDAAQHADLLVTHASHQEEVLTFAREVAGSLSLRYVLRGVCKHASAIAGGSRVVVWLMEPSRRTLEPFADSAAPDMQPIGLHPIAAGEGIVGAAGQYGRLVDGANGDRAPLAVPMVVGAQVIGVLELPELDRSAWSGESRAVLETMAIHAAAAVHAARLHEQTSDMAMTDVLTGLPNRRRLDTDLAVEAAAAARYDRPLALVMIDVDHFKSYNDEFGHQAGDVALQAVARILSRDLRPTDRAYRFGGEEFCLVLREATLDGAASVAERIRAGIEHHFTSPLEPRAVTMSAGVAALRPQEPTPEALIRAADEALYDAKRDGRNQVKVAGPAATV